MNNLHEGRGSTKTEWLKMLRFGNNYMVQLQDENLKLESKKAFKEGLSGRNNILSTLRGPHDEAHNNENF